MITIPENYLNSLYAAPSSKMDTTLRLLKAQYLMHFIPENPKPETNDFQGIFDALLRRINKTRYGGINAEIEPFNFQTVCVRDMRKYGTYVKNSIFATNKYLFLMYNNDFFIRFNLKFTEQENENQ